MTEDELVAFALGLPEAAEASHFGTRDFRVRGKIFLALPSREFGVIKLTPDQQRLVLETAAGTVTAVPGGWGLRGWTRVHFLEAGDDMVRHLVRRAWTNVAPKSLRQTDS